MLVVTFRFRQPFLVAYRGTPTSSFSWLALLVAGSCTLVWLVANLCQWGPSPGLSCCFTMLLRCADWLSLWLCVHSLLGCRVSWPSCRSFALQLALVFQTSVVSLLPYGSHPSRWGHPYGVEAGLSSIRTKVRVFRFPFWGCFFLLSLPLGFWSPYGSVCWLVPAYARPTILVGATHFLLLDVLRATVCGSSLRPVALGRFPGGPSCGQVSSVVLSSLQCSSLSLVLVTCLPPWHWLRALGCPWCLTLAPSRWGLCLHRRLFLAPCSCLRFLSWWSSLRLLVFGGLGSIHCSSLPVGTLPCPPALPLLPSAGCLLYLALYPSGWASPPT